MTARSPTLALHGDKFAWSMLAAAPHAVIVVAADGEIAYANDHAAEMFGYSLEELVGRVVDDLLPEAQRSVHRADRTRYRADPVARVMAPSSELWAKRADGVLIAVEVSLSPLQVGGDTFVVAFIEDIAGRLVIEEQLRRVLATMDAIDDGVFMFDATTLRYSYVNEGAVRLTGYERDELLTMSPLHVNPATSDAEYRGLIDTLHAADTVAIVREATLIRKDGSEVDVEKTLWLAPKARNGTNWVISLARDITARRASDADRLHTAEVLHAAEQVLAVADDRERIARDLHDTVIQRLFGEGLQLQAIVGALVEPAQAKVLSVIVGLDETIKQLRAAIFSLQGVENGAPGRLRSRILDVFADATAALEGDPQLEFVGPIETVRDEIADHLLPVLTEALTNVVHHAEARTVEVVVSVAGHVTLTIADDGVGPPPGPSTGHGLPNMAERARDLGGTFSITARESGGTLLTWEVPAMTASTVIGVADAPSATGLHVPAVAGASGASTVVVRN